MSDDPISNSPENVFWREAFFASLHRCPPEDAFCEADEALLLWRGRIKEQIDEGKQPQQGQ